MSTSDEHLPIAQAIWPPTKESQQKHDLEQGAENKTEGAGERFAKYFDDPKQAYERVGEVGEETPHTTVIIATATWDDPVARREFIRKVYSILAAQMALTFLVCAVMTLHIPTRNYVLTNGIWMLNLAVVLSFVVLIALFCYKDKHPTNLILLGIWTFVEAYTIGTITAMYAVAGASDIVLEAVFLTATAFIALTVFTLQSKWDFSWLGAGLGVCLWILLIWGILAMIFGFQTGMVYALFGTVLFSGYIIFDTWMLTGTLSPNDYIIAAISLYLDIINLFLMILQLLSDNDRR